MQIEFTPQQLALKEELRAYFQDLMTPKLVAELDAAGAEGGGGPEFRRAMKKMGRDGWIGLGWPERYGGRGATPMEQYLFVEEVMRAGFPFPFLTTESVGPVLARAGSERMQRELVPAILAGELIFAIGYSEPDAGTDLAALKTRAERDGPDWIIKGQKTWTSLADYADYVWLAVRTDPEASRHKGLSILVVPIDAEGFSLSPIRTLGGVRTNATFYDDVRVPGDALVGEAGGGWKLITGQLNRERLALVNHGSIERLFEDVVAWAALQTTGDGGRLLDQPWVRQTLARIKVGCEAIKLMNWKQAWAMTEKELQMADASVAKVFGTEFFIEAYRGMMEILGETSLLKKDSPGAVLKGKLETMYRTASILTFGGGTNEVQRDIIAAAGLQMPLGARGL